MTTFRVTETQIIGGPALAAHEARTEDVHGIEDTADLVTQTMLAAAIAGIPVSDFDPSELLAGNNTWTGVNVFKGTSFPGWQTTPGEFDQRFAVNAKAKYDPNWSTHAALTAEAYPDDAQKSVGIYDYGIQSTAGVIAKAGAAWTGDPWFFGMWTIVDAAAEGAGATFSSDTRFFGLVSLATSRVPAGTTVPKMAAVRAEYRAAAPLGSYGTVDELAMFDAAPATFSPGNGPVTNMYGLRLRPMGQTVTNRWGVYQEDPAAANVLKGVVKVGNVSGASPGFFDHMPQGVISYAAAFDADYWYGGLAGQFTAVDPGGNPGTFWNGAQGYAQIASDANAWGVTGAAFANHATTGFRQVVGVKGEVDAGAAGIASVAALQGEINAFAAATVVNAYGLRLPAANVSGGSVITNRYGVSQEDPAAKNVYLGTTIKGQGAIVYGYDGPGSTLAVPAYSSYWGGRLGYWAVAQDSLADPDDGENWGVYAHTRQLRPNAFGGGGLVGLMNYIGATPMAAPPTSRLIGSGVLGYALSSVGGAHSLASLHGSAIIGGAAAVANHYGLLLSTPVVSGAGITNRYGVYQEDSLASNVFKGVVGIGIDPKDWDGTRADNAESLQVVHNAANASPSQYAATLYGNLTGRGDLFYVSGTSVPGASAKGAALRGEMTSKSGGVTSGVTSGELLGVEGGLFVQSGTTVAAAAALYGRASVQGTVTDLYGLHLPTAIISGGTITNRYGISQEDPLAKNVLRGRTVVGNPALVSGGPAYGLFSAPAFDPSWGGSEAVVGESDDDGTHGDGWGFVGVSANATVRSNSHVTGVSGAVSLRAPSQTQGGDTAGVAGWVYGMSGSTTHAASLYASAFQFGGTITNYYGLRLDAPLIALGTITNRYGVYQGDPFATNFFAGPMIVNQIAGGGSGISSTLNIKPGAFTGVGVNSYVIADETGISQAIGVTSEVDVYAGTPARVAMYASYPYISGGATTVVAGLYDAPEVASGTVTNLYGVLLKTATGAGLAGVTNRYGIYQEDPAARNVFKGRTDWGDSTFTTGAGAELWAGASYLTGGVDFYLQSANGDNYVDLSADATDVEFVMAGTGGVVALGADATSSSVEARYGSHGAVLVAYNNRSALQLTPVAAPPAVLGSLGFVYEAADGSLHYRGPTTDTQLAPA